METKHIELLISFLLPIFIASGVLLATYKILLSKSNRFQFNRFFLIASLLFSFALPFIKVRPKTALHNSMISVDNILNYIMLDEIAVTSGGQAQSAWATTSFWNSFNVFDVLSYIYIIGVVVFLVMLVYKILKIYALAGNSRFEKREKCTFVYTDNNITPFSFLRHIFLPNGELNQQIIRHEASHVKHHHSLDILFVEICTALQWFNPFMRLYKRELQNLHEYAADYDVINGGADTKDYMMLILQQCTAVSFNTIGNNFSYSSTKKRIKMITQHKKSKAVLFKSLLTLPVLGLLLLFNCTSSPEKAQTPVLDDNVEAKTAEKPTVSNEAIENKTLGESQEADTIFRVVENMPEFPGGSQAMLDFVSKNIVYPEKALKDSISGKVYVSFVVEKDGNISNVKVLRGIGAGCDEEAVRVISMMPKWIPANKDGQPVRVSFTLPIIFKIKD